MPSSPHYRRCRTWFVLTVAVMFLSPANVVAQTQPRAWPTVRAEQLTVQATRHVNRGDLALANARLSKALSFDSTYGPAYLVLGRVRQAEGHHAEALRVYTAGIFAVSAFVDGFRARATLYERLSRFGESAHDREQAIRLAPHNLQIRQEIIDYYIRRQAWSAALQASRAVVVRLEVSGQPELARVERLRAVALSRLANQTDPVVAGDHQRRWERRSLAAIGRRYGAL